MISTYVRLQMLHFWPLHPTAVSSFYLTVKYLREVTPYFRKASISNDIGWDLSHRFLSTDVAYLPTPSSKPPRPDTRHIPLVFCFLTRNLTMIDPEMRTFELHSPDRRSICILRCSDCTEASSWFNAIHSAINLLTNQALAETNHLLVDVLKGNEIRHSGWLSEKVRWFFFLQALH